MDASCVLQNDALVPYDVRSCVLSEVVRHVSSMSADHITGTEEEPLQGEVVTRLKDALQLVTGDGPTGAEARHKGFTYAGKLRYPFLRYALEFQIFRKTRTQNCINGIIILYL